MRDVEDNEGAGAVQPSLYFETRVLLELKYVCLSLTAIRGWHCYNYQNRGIAPTSPLPQTLELAKPPNNWPGRMAGPRHQNPFPRPLTWHSPLIVGLSK